MNFITRRHLSRRTLLRGAGAAIALPLLESMLPAATALAQTAAVPRTRFGAIYIPHGATMARWTPETEGTAFEFPSILKPLEPFRSAINVISDLSHPQGYGGGSATANHNRSSAVFLSGAMAQAGTRPYLGITADQVAARHIGQDTPLPSLELTIEPASLSCGEGLSCAYRNTISWQGPESPLPMQDNPQVVFEQLFGDGATREERAARRAQSVSLLDAAAEQLRSLDKALPAGDRAVLEQYVTDIREVERRIEQAGQQVTPDIAVPDRPSGIPDDVEAHIKLMLDLMVLAWQAEITRVSTFMLAKELSNAVYPNSGIRDSFHILSHHSNILENKERFAELNRYHVSLLAYLLDRLQATPAGDGSLLDHAMVLYGSGISDGNQHNHGPLPIVLAGNASGRLTGGRHIRNVPETTMSNLLLAMLHKLGVEQEAFGDSNGLVAI